MPTPNRLYFPALEIEIKLLIQCPIDITCILLLHWVVHHHRHLYYWIQIKIVGPLSKLCIKFRCSIWAVIISQFSANLFKFHYDKIEIYFWIGEGFGQDQTHPSLFYIMDHSLIFSIKFLIFHQNPRASREMLMPTHVQAFRTLIYFKWNWME